MNLSFGMYMCIYIDILHYSYSSGGLIFISLAIKSALYPELFDHQCIALLFKLS